MRKPEADKSRRADQKVAHAFRQGGATRSRAWHRADCGLRDEVANLCRLVPLWPSEWRAERKDDRLRLLSRLRRALKDERQRGLAGHWAYDLARHAQLVDAYQAEVKRFLVDFGTAPSMTPVGSEARGKPAP